MSSSRLIAATFREERLKKEIAAKNEKIDSKKRTIKKLKSKLNHLESSVHSSIVKSLKCNRKGRTSKEDNLIVRKQQVLNKLNILNKKKIVYKMLQDIYRDCDNVGVHLTSELANGGDKVTKQLIQQSNKLRSEMTTINQDLKKIGIEQKLM